MRDVTNDTQLESHFTIAHWTSLDPGSPENRVGPEEAALVIFLPSSGTSLGRDSQDESNSRIHELHYEIRDATLLARGPTRFDRVGTEWGPRDRCMGRLVDK